MNQFVKYRQNAADFCEMARILSDPHKKVKMLAMAQSWKLLADLAEGNSNLDPSTTPPRATAKLDHVIPLELGGDPCAGEITLENAQQSIWRDWRAAAAVCG